MDEAPLFQLKSNLLQTIVFDLEHKSRRDVKKENREEVQQTRKTEKRHDMAAARAPLLENDDKEQGEGGRVSVWNKVLDIEEAKTQIMFSVPVILTNVSYYSITVVSVMFAGHLGELELAASNLANSWGTVTGFALMVGLSGALETLCGQGYGAKLYRMLGIHLQSSIITLVFFAVVVSFIWFYSEAILILLHQEPQVAELVGVYMKHLIPGLFAYSIIQCLLRFIQTQSVVIPLVICSLVPMAFHVGITYVLVYCTVLGFKGAALSAGLSLWISVIMLGLYVNYSEKFKYTWDGFSVECFKHVLPSMKLAIPSAIMVCLEYWAFELLVLLAGLMPNSENSTSLIAMCVNTEALSYMFTYGFSAAVSTRVSNELGARNVDGAKNAVLVTLKISILVSLTAVLFLVFGHNIWASAFSNSSVIKKEFASMTPLLAISILLDATQGILSGVARGCGWQHLAAWTNLIAFYGIGMPIAVLVGFVAHLDAKGLWIGLISGLFCQAFTLLVITLRTNWAKLELSVKNDKESIVVV